ncbi:uncharacterized protein [Penaeus vannamei]|uniref:uncharacterized protein n=1 Tax=Penaeus vannamei TaxID=6689 RepID=UPI00387F957D
MAFGRWNEAVQTDGQFIMAQVTQRLYEGGNLRPDAYYEKIPGFGRTKYNKDFVWSQKRIIESCDCDFDIWDAAKKFDISLHWILQKNVCGLQPADELYKLLQKLVHKRNEVSHSFEFDDNEDINEELDDLLSLYIEILDRLEERSLCNLTEVKKQVRNSIQEKKLDSVFTSWSRPTIVNTREIVRSNASRREESPEWVKALGIGGGVRSNASRREESPEWGKVLAIGGGVAVAGAAALGLASLLSSRSKSQEDERRERQRSRNQTSSQEECVVM